MNKTLPDILDGLRFQPVRTGLALFAVSLGMMALTALLAVAGGLRERTRALSEAIGSQVFAVLSGTDAEAKLTRREAATVAANLPGTVVSGVRRLTAGVPGGNDRWTVIGSDGNLASVRRWRIKGRFIDARDVQEGARVAVVTTARDTTPSGWSGGQLVLFGMPFAVVGEVSPSPALPDAAAAEGLVVFGERTVFVPHTALPSAAAGGPERVDALLVHAGSLADFDGVVAGARRLLGQERPDASFRWVTAESAIAGLKRLNAVIASAVGAVAILCILLGGTTLVSLMVANVRDRIPEIGLRRALGARPADIAGLFVAESCLVTGAAALIGTAAAHAVFAALGDGSPVPLHTGIGTVVAPLLTALVLGGLFAFWPARLAAKILPSDALRGE